MIAKTYFLTLHACILFALVPSADAEVQVLEAAQDFVQRPASASTAPSYVESGSNAPSTSGLAIDTSKFFDATASAYATFKGREGLYNIELLAVGEEDGQSRYQIRVDGKPIGKRRTPETKTKRLPVWLDFGKVKLDPDNLIEVFFQGNTNRKIDEGTGYAWSRGRWRAVRLTPVRSVPDKHLQSDTLIHASLWSTVYHPVPVTDSPTVTNPFGELVQPIRTDHSEANTLVAFIPNELGIWTLEYGNSRIEYAVHPSKYLGPLQAWSRDPSVLASGNDRPLKLIMTENPAPSSLLKSPEALKSYINDLHHSPVNLVTFTAPLLPTLENSEVSLNEATWAAKLKDLDTLFKSFSEKAIYVLLAEPIVSPSAYSQYSTKEQTRLKDSLRKLVSLHWNVIDSGEWEKLLTNNAISLEQNGWLSLIDRNSSTRHTGQLAPINTSPSPASKKETTHNAPLAEAVFIEYGSYPDLTFDSSGLAHLVYARNGTLFYRNWNANDGILSEETETPIRFREKWDSPHRSDPEISIDPLGRLHVLAGAQYAIMDTNGWKEVESTFVRDTALAIDQAGNAFICKRGGNHDGRVGIDYIPSGKAQLTPTEKDPDSGTAFGKTWVLDKYHPYGHVFTDNKDTLYLVYRQGAPDFIAWRSTSDLGKTWTGGGVYGGDIWQSEAPSGIVDSSGTVFVIGPTGWLFSKPRDCKEFQTIGHALDCWGRDLSEIGIINENTLAMASFGGRLSYLESGVLNAERRIPSPDGRAIGFVSLARDDSSSRNFAFFETGDEVDNEKPSETGSLWLLELKDGYKRSTVSPPLSNN